MRSTINAISSTNFGRFTKITLSGNHVLRVHGLPVMPCVDAAIEAQQCAQMPSDTQSGRCKCKHLSYWHAERPSSLAFAT